MCDFFSRMCARKSVIKNMCVTLRETRVTRCVTPLSSTLNFINTPATPTISTKPMTSVAPATSSTPMKKKLPKKSVLDMFPIPDGFYASMLIF